MKHCKICFQSVDEGVSLYDYYFKEDIICGYCRRKMKIADKIYKYQNLHIHALYHYDEFMENFLFQYKEGRDIALKDIFLYPYKQKLIDKYRQYEWVLMPSSEEKIRQRTFHHLECMIEDLDIKIGHHFCKNQNFKQSSQKLQTRTKIKEMIQMTTKPQRPYILFDDVITTGNTLLTAANLCAEKDEIIHCLAVCIHPMFVEKCDAFQL